MKTLNLIYEKSNSLRIPYENLIAGCAIEVVIENLFKTKKTSLLELCNGWEYNMAGYQRYRYNQIMVYSYLPHQNQMEHFLEECFQQTIISIKEIRIIEEQKLQVADLIVLLDELAVAVQLLIYEKDQKKEAGEYRSLPSVLDNQKKLNYVSAKMEVQIADLIEEIVYYMDFIPDMSSYYRLYQIIHREMIEGRKVVDYLKKVVNKDLFSDERKASFFDGDWSLERREMWSVFIKRMHIEDLLFEELFQTCQKFMEPLWDAIQKDEIFFGDWMPEPERFI